MGNSEEVPSVPSPPSAAIASDAPEDADGSVPIFSLRNVRSSSSWTNTPG